MVERPNIVLFVPDQLRADALSCYGNEHTSTPHFDRLAAEGVRFDQCHTQSVLCTPSRCSFLTGWYPHVRGHRNLWHLLQPDEPNLFRSLRRAGYEVVAFGKNDVFSPGAIPHSLDSYVSLPGPNNGPNSWEMEDERRYSFLVDPFPGEPEETKDARHVALACEYLESRSVQRQKPFVLFIPLTLPHPPYGPPEPYYSRYSPDEVSVRPPREDEVPEFHELVRSYRHLDRADESLFRKIRAVYYGMVDYMDWMLGQVMSTLERTGLDESTYLIATSDHGDLAGDYGLVEKIHNAHYDPLTRVPLIIRGPRGMAADSEREDERDAGAGATQSAQGSAGPTGGRVVERPVALMDIMATIHEATRVPIEHTHFSRSLLGALDGSGIARSATTANTATLEPPWAPLDLDELSGGPAVFTENGFRVDETHCFEGSEPGDGTWNPDGHYYPQTRQHQERPDTIDRVITMRTETEKLCYRPRGLSEYFDLESDPDELSNRFHDPACAERVRELEGRLLRWLALSSDAVPFHHDPRGFPE